MKEVRLIAALAAVLAFPGTAWAVDCAKWGDHMPGYCGVTSNDYQCNSPANRVRGKCAIPDADWYVDSSGKLIDNKAQNVLAMAGTFELKTPAGVTQALVASGGGNLVASGGGNLEAGRTVMGAGNKRVFIVRR